MTSFSSWNFEKETKNYFCNQKSPHTLVTVVTCSLVTYRATDILNRFIWIPRQKNVRKLFGWNVRTFFTCSQFLTHHVKESCQWVHIVTVTIYSSKLIEKTFQHINLIFFVCVRIVIGEKHLFSTIKNWRRVFFHPLLYVVKNTVIITFAVCIRWWWQTMGIFTVCLSSVCITQVDIFYLKNRGYKIIHSKMKKSNWCTYPVWWKHGDVSKHLKWQNYDDLTDISKMKSIFR